MKPICKLTRLTVKEQARHDYELNLIKQPLYHDGTQRPEWDALGRLAKHSWMRHARERQSFLIQ